MKTTQAPQTEEANPPAPPQAGEIPDPILTYLSAHKKDRQELAEKEANWTKELGKPHATYHVGDGDEREFFWLFRIKAGIIRFKLKKNGDIDFHSKHLYSNNELDAIDVAYWATPDSRFK
jgi:hypothetical protein